MKFLSYRYHLILTRGEPDTPIFVPYGQLVEPWRRGLIENYAGRGRWQTGIRRGDLFVTTEAIEMTGMVRFYKPASDGFRCIVKAGTKLRAELDLRPGAVSFMALPVQYKEHEPLLVPAEIRSIPNYWKYSLSPRAEWVGTKLLRVQQ